MAWIAARDLRRGDVVRPPWTATKNDEFLTGIVVSVARGTVRICWNGDGDCTAAGDETTLAADLSRVERLASCSHKGAR